MTSIVVSLMTVTAVPGTVPKFTAVTETDWKLLPCRRTTEPPPKGPAGGRIESSWKPSGAGGVLPPPPQADRGVRIRIRIQTGSRMEWFCIAYLSLLRLRTHPPLCEGPL